ncbi:FitA-like ribbon-helix-helix domain-containing protein [Candidatus Nitrospira salsa]|nr:MAG: hypothetical protein NPIRA01_01220 [Nitrospirales bacterium]
MTSCLDPFIFPFFFSYDLTLLVLSEYGLCDIDDIEVEDLTMGQLIVRNIEEDVKLRLRQRAFRHGRSVEEEVRDILRNATKNEGKRTDGFGSAMSRLFQGIGLQKDIPELKGTSPQSTDFES